mgnify:CR=1 FL=1
MKLILVLSSKLGISICLLVEDSVQKTTQRRIRAGKINGRSDNKAIGLFQQIDAFIDFVVLDHAVPCFSQPDYRRFGIDSPRTSRAEFATTSTELR